MPGFASLATSSRITRRTILGATGKADGNSEEGSTLQADGTGLPQTCLSKSTVNRYSKHSKKKRRNKLLTEPAA